MKPTKNKPSYSDLESRIRNLEIELNQNRKIISQIFHSRHKEENSGDKTPEEIDQLFNDFPEYPNPEETLNEIRPILDSLFDMLNCFVYCQMLYRNGKPHDFIFLSVNKSFETQTGLKNVLGRKISEIIPGIRKSSPNLFEILGRVTKTGQPERFEMYIKALDLWISASVSSPLKEHFIAVFDVINERKQIIQALRESEERLREVLENSLDASYKRNLETKVYDYLSPVFTQLTGYRWEESKFLTPEKYYDLIHPDDREEVNRIFKLSMTGPPGIACHLEYRFKHNNGMYRWLHDQFTVVRDEKKQPKSIIGSKRDITEHRQAEELLRESEEKYRNVFAAERDSFFLIDHDTSIILDANDTACRLYGYSKEEMLKLKNSDLYNDPEDANKALKEFTPRIELCYHKKKDGSIFPVDISASFFVVKERQFILAAVRDITKRMKGQEEIKQKNLELTKLIAEKDKLFSIIAHDLRSPFNSLLGFTQLLADDLQSMSMDQIQETVLILRDTAANIFGLLENLLQWSRIQRGIINYNPEFLQLNSEIEKAIELIQEFATKKKIDIISHIPEDFTVFVDPNMFGVIVRNLLSNGVKFSNPGGKINISTQIIDNHLLQISITDNGIGMNPDLLSKIFNPEELITRTGTNGEPSTGLGLMLCKEFVEKHGGEIWVSSSAGKGSTFSFTIPYQIVS